MQGRTACNLGAYRAVTVRLPNALSRRRPHLAYTPAPDDQPTHRPAVESRGGTPTSSPRSAGPGKRSAVGGERTRATAATAGRRSPPATRATSAATPGQRRSAGRLHLYRPGPARGRRGVAAGASPDHMARASAHMDGGLAFHAHRRNRGAGRLGRAVLGWGAVAWFFVQYGTRSGLLSPNEVFVALASQSALQVVVGFVAGWYGGYLRRRLADQRPRPVAGRARRR